MREGKGFVLVFKGFLIALKLKITYTYASNVKVKTYFLGLSNDTSLVYFFCRLLLIQIENLYYTLSDEKNISYY